MKALNPPATEDSSEARESPESSGPTGELGALREELGTERSRREMAESTLHEGMAEEQRRREEAERERDDLRRKLYARREPRESPQTAQEEPEKAEPQPATVEAQEDTERPQQRSGWLVPVDKLPWWHYGLGLFLVFSGGFLAVTLSMLIAPSVVAYPILLAIAWPSPGIFGFWVGYRKRDLRLWSQVLPLGALLGGVAFIGLECGRLGRFSFVSFAYLDTLDLLRSLAIVFFPAWLLFVSASLLGNTWQRRRIGRISGTTPASPVSRTRQRAAQQPRKDLTPAQQAMLGWGGTIISALITLVGTIITLRSGQ
jgi:hypothetical protein